MGKSRDSYKPLWGQLTIIGYHACTRRNQPSEGSRNFLNSHHTCFGNLWGTAREAIPPSGSGHEGLAHSGTLRLLVTHQVGMDLGPAQLWENWDKGCNGLGSRDGLGPGGQRDERQSCVCMGTLSKRA